MRASVFLIVLLLVASAATAEQAQVQVAFGQPSQYWGEPTLASGVATEAAIEFSAGTIQLWVEEGMRVVETTRNDVGVRVPEVGFDGDGTPQEREYQISKAGWLEVTPSPESNLAFVESVSILPSVEASRLAATTWSGHEEFIFDGPHGPEFHRSFEKQVRWETPGVIVANPERAPLAISQSDVRSIESANSIVHCHGVEPCPSSEEEGVQSFGGGAAVLRPNLWVRIEHPLQVEVEAEDARVQWFSTEFELSGNMAARLPAVEGVDCQAIGCDGDKTLRLDGEVAFSNMHRAEDGRFAASISGDVEHLILDEQPIDPALLWGVAVGSVAMGAIVATLLSKLGLFGLFTRISAEEALEHPRRKVLFSYITENPGTTFRELVRKTGIPAGTARHHLNVMRRSELVVEKPHKSTLRFFENHGKYDASWDTVVMLREEPLREIHQWVMENPESNQKTIVAAMAERGHSRGTTQHRLSRLLDAGLVTFRHQGRLKIYTAHAQPQAPRHQERGWSGLDAAWPRPEFS